MKNEFMLVGVGASAGGLEALQSFLSGVDKSSNVSIIIAQHLSSNYKSMLSQLLKNHCKLPVSDVEDGAQIESHKVYVCPPGYDVKISERNFQLVKPNAEEQHHPSPSVDQLFQSMAERWVGPKAGVILSGTGRDGTSGLLALRSHGGITAAQSADTAKYDDMPGSAQKSMDLDVIAPPAKLFSEIIKYQSHLSELIRHESELKSERELMLKILNDIDGTFGTSFQHYKTGTTFRRIYNRMTALTLSSVEKYYEVVRNDKNEQVELMQNLLIGVTDFFRDFEVFFRFQKHIKQIVTNKKTKNIRAWVAGCSRGQEAYSVALMIAEVIGGAINDWDIKIFSTDIDEISLDYARAGVYTPKDVENIPEQLLRRYFTYKNGHYHVEKSLRELLVFSRHDLCVDPPYVRLDLVTCRNVLIYFQERLQLSVLNSFLYSLQPEGMLLLGRSESLGQVRDQFKVIDADAKIFQAKTSQIMMPRSVRHDYWVPFSPRVETSKTRETEDNSNMSFALYESLVKEQMPHNVIVDQDGKVVYVSANNPYLTINEGSPSNILSDLIHPDLKVVFRLLIAEYKQNRRGESRPSNVNLFGKAHQHVKLRAIPLTLKNIERVDLLIISFIEVELTLHDVKPESLDEKTKYIIENLKEELASSRREAKRLLVEIDDKNQELEVSNEELQSMNEELQSSNEELEATVEELETAYSALKAAYEEGESKSRQLEESKRELDLLNQDYRRAQKVAQIGHFKWDMQTHQIQWSEQMYEIFGVPVSTEINRELVESLYFEEDYQSVIDATETSLETGLLNAKFRIKRPKLKRGFIHVHGQGQLRINPESGNKELLGTVSVIDNLMDLEDKARHFEQNLANTISNSLTGIYIYNFSQQKYSFINKRYMEITGYNERDIQNMTSDEFFELFHPEDQRSVSDHFMSVLNSRHNESFTLKYRFKHKGGHWLWLLSQDSVSARSVAGRPLEFTGSFVDITQEETKPMDSGMVGLVNIDQSKHGLLTLDSEGKVLSASRKAVELLGLAEGEIEKFKFIDENGDKSLSKEKSLWRQLVDGKLTNVSYIKSNEGYSFKKPIKVDMLGVSRANAKLDSAIVYLETTE